MLFKKKKLDPIEARHQEQHRRLVAAGLQLGLNVNVRMSHPDVQIRVSEERRRLKLLSGPDTTSQDD